MSANRVNVLQKIAGSVFLATILIVSILLHRAHASNGVYSSNHAYATDTYATAFNDVRVNVSTPPGYYTGYGNCKAWIDDESAESRGTIWAKVISSGWDGSYVTSERSVSVSGNRQVTSGATASGSF